jgi:hypothetical protein
MSQPLNVRQYRQRLLQDLQGLLGPQAPQKRKGFVVQRQTTHLGL